ncbi:leucine-rich repeat-containing protein 14-like [Tubulanus polymorphus]|uniref:leucine-rich repeat-containing protein 14-like n=1 Tax=Tubulanus polymorphus TaxID=672921 RepID=UPI003DA2D82B
MDKSFMFNCKGACYPLKLADDINLSLDKPIAPLVDIAAAKIVESSSVTHACLDFIPTELFINLMQAALLYERDASVAVLIHKWPWQKLILKNIAPVIDDNLLILHDCDLKIKKVRRGLKYTTTLVTNFLDCRKKRSPSKLKFMDLSGFPVADVITHYLCSHCLLVFNENRQREIIKLYNECREQIPHLPQANYTVDETFPDEQYVVRLDAFVRTKQLALELIKAAQVSDNCTLRIEVNKLDLTCLGEGVIGQVLTEVDKERLLSLRLQYNSLTSDSMVTLAPVLQQCHNVTELDISCNGLVLIHNRAACDAVRNVLKQMKFIRRLDLSNCWVRNSLFLLLENVAMPLQHLCLNGCRLTSEDLEYLARSRHATALVELDLSENHFSDCNRAVRNLLVACKSSLKILEIEDCKLNDVDLLTLVSLASSLDELRFLNVNHNRFTDPTVTEAVRAFAKTSDLQVLKLSCPEIYVSANNADVFNMNYDEDTGMLMFCGRMDAIVQEMASKMEVVVT